jgi:hypothetical protein
MKTACPQCGADIELQPRALQLICPFCNTALKFTKEPSLERYRIEPTIEETPATAIAREALLKQNRPDSIETKALSYLPFYRFLCEENGSFKEHVCAACADAPFPFFSIPSGTLAVLAKDEPIKGPKPEKPLSEVLSRSKLKNAKSIEEMLLLFLPFWKITLSTGEVIWIDAVEGHVVAAPPRGKRRPLRDLRTPLILSLTLSILFAAGIMIPPLLLRLPVQMAIAVLGFFILRKEMKHAS